jgi:uncharacterized protein YbaP (TraB family)
MLSKILTFGWLLYFIQAHVASPCQPYEYRTDPDVSRLPQAESFLLEVTSSQKDMLPSYLFGSFHSADASVLQRWSALLMLLATRPIRVFISERDLAEPVASALQQLPAGEQLSTLLAQQAGLYERIVAILTRYRLPAAAAEHFKPWFAAALLNQIAAMPQDRTVKIFDEYLLHSVRELGIETRFLEKFSDIAGYYEQNFSADEQIRLLWEAVCNQKVLEQLTHLQAQAYAANRVGEFYRLLQRYSGSDKVLSDKLVDVFVQQRNAAFWQELRPQLQQGGAFIAIGSLHVLGEDGLLQRLEQ